MAGIWLENNFWGVTEESVPRPHRPGQAEALYLQQVVGTAFLPYVRSVTDRDDCIGKSLEQCGARAVYLLTQRIQQCLHSVKDTRDPLSSCRECRVLCSSGMVYVGTTKQHEHPHWWTQVTLLSGPIWEIYHCQTCHVQWRPQDFVQWNPSVVHDLSLIHI